MRERVAKLGRILQVQERFAQAEEWKLATLERKLAEAATAQSELMQALNVDHELHGLFLDVMARRLRTLAEEIARLDSDKALRSKKLLAQTARLRTAARLLETAAADMHNQEARRELLQLIDELAGRDCISLP